MTYLELQDLISRLSMLQAEVTRLQYAEAEAYGEKTAAIKSLTLAYKALELASAQVVDTMAVVRFRNEGEE